MTPVAVTAHLYSGFVSSDQWSPTLDGILAYWQRYEQLGADHFSVAQGHGYQMTTVDDLPLEKTTHNELWWYAVSSPIYTASMTARRYIHRRFDQANAEKYLVDDIKKIQTQSGAYKNARLSLNHVITDKVIWHVIGDRAEIERLLAHCWHIGAKHGAGFGRVRRWEFNAGDADIARLQRPLPVDYALAHQREGSVMHWGIRPPARLPENNMQCVMP